MDRGRFADSAEVFWSISRSGRQQLFVRPQAGKWTGRTSWAAFAYSRYSRSVGVVFSVLTRLRQPKWRHQVA